MPLWPTDIKQRTCYGALIAVMQRIDDIKQLKLYALCEHKGVPVSHTLNENKIFTRLLDLRKTTL